MFITKAIAKNTKITDKPNEDFVICDSKKNIFILLDGVSRDQVNGKYPNPSPAKEAAELLGDSIYEQLCSFSNSSNGELLLKDIKKAIMHSNALIAEYNNQNNLDFLSGAVGLVAVLNDNMLCCCYIGDCSGRIIRGNKITLFTEMQTERINKHKKDYSTYEIRNVICNNPDHPLSYGVLNGDSRAELFIRSKLIQLYPQDHIILASDGLEPFLSTANIEILKSNCANMLLHMAIDKNNILQDDRSIIKIVV